MKDNLRDKELLKSVEKELKELNENKDEYKKLRDLSMKSLRINKKEKQLLYHLNELEDIKLSLHGIPWDTSKEERVENIKRLYSTLQIAANIADGLLSLERDLSESDRDELRRFIHPF